MFGISWYEFFVIVLVAIFVIPARYWPDVAKFLARIVKFIRNLIWKITDASEQIQEQIDLQKPIDDLIHTTTDDILSDFSVNATKRKRAKKSK
ncbi:MAG: twin-arginine translocase TatA/TatE family subunit [Alphaproteobacteria bacterium]|nr:twin-arginine translocase TatA/TatE family subunit [Alphaproteobacteria bacterium]